MMADQTDKNKFLSQSIEFNYKMLVSACRFMTLYLLKKYSDTEYLFQDSLERQYRVKLEKQIQCTCHQGNLGHCIHSLYILIKIYKLPQNHPFLFQKSYQQDDVKKLISLGKSLNESKHKQKQTIQKQIKEKQGQDVVKSNVQRLILNKQQKAQKSQKNEMEQKQWPKFEAETVCSICYDQIQNQSPIIECLSCKNYYHTKCLKVWICQKRMEDNSSLTCPMCRGQFQKSIDQRIISMDKYYVQYHQSHGIACSACAKDILVKIFKCLLCQAYYLCQSCYLKWEHKNHNRFIGKQNKKSDWIVTERSDFNMNKLNANLQYVKKFGASMDSELIELMGPKYQQFISSQIKKSTLKQHIINSLVDVEKQIHKTYKKIDFTESDIICCACKKKKIVGMKRLPCKHFIDQKCLKFLLMTKFKQCPVDKKPILPGLSDITLNIQ